MTGDVEALAQRHALGASAQRRLAVLLEALTEPHAPTAIHDRRRVAEDHLADSLVALQLDVVRAANRICDVGAGAGLPGLPLAIGQEHASVTLLEASARKAAFIAGTAEQCGLENVVVLHTRAEQHALDAPAYDLVTVRAVSSFAVVIEYAAPLLRVGGALVAWRGRRDPEAEAEANRAAEIVGMQVHEVLPVTPYPSATDRHLHVVLKVRETPERFPRRAGIALKRPLGR